MIEIRLSTVDRLAERLLFPLSRDMRLLLIKDFRVFRRDPMQWSQSIVFLALLFYVYGVAGVFLFGRNDPAHFGKLGVAMLTLFTVVTLEGWADLMYRQIYGCDPTGEGTAAALCRMPEAQPLVAQ